MNSLGKVFVLIGLLALGACGKESTKNKSGNGLMASTSSPTATPTTSTSQATSNLNSGSLEAKMQHVGHVSMNQIYLSPRAPIRTGEGSKICDIYQRNYFEYYFKLDGNKLITSLYSNMSKPMIYIRESGEQNSINGTYLVGEEVIVDAVGVKKKIQLRMIIENGMSVHLVNRCIFE